MAFMIFWRTERYEQAAKYIELCQNYIYMVIGENQEEGDHRPIIEEGSPIEKVIEVILLSDDEGTDNVESTAAAANTRRTQRLSMLSKLNLLGLISLAGIALNQRMARVNLNDTREACKMAIEEL